MCPSHSIRYFEHLLWELSFRGHSFKFLFCFLFLFCFWTLLFNFWVKLFVIACFMKPFVSFFLGRLSSGRKCSFTKLLCFVHRNVESDSARCFYLLRGYSVFLYHSIFACLFHLPAVFHADFHSSKQSRMCRQFLVLFLFLCLIFSPASIDPSPILQVLAGVLISCGVISFRELL